MQRWEITFTGTVQGVGFRYTTTRIAWNFNVTGFVKNIPDGSVRLVAEGPEDELSSFLNRIQDRMSGYIRDTQVGKSEAAGEFNNFTVGY
mgnify:FL=1